MAGVKTKRFYFIMKTKNVRIASMPEQAQLVPASKILNTILTKSKHCHNLPLYNSSNPKNAGFPRISQMPCDSMDNH